MTLQDLYNKTAVVIKATHTSTNDYGEPVFSTADGESFECVLQPDKGEYNIEVEGVVIMSTHRVYCDPGVNVVPGDYLKFGVVKYEVLAVLDDAGRGNHFKLMLRLIQ